MRRSTTTLMIFISQMITIDYDLSLPKYWLSFRWENIIIIDDDVPDESRTFSKYRWHKDEMKMTSRRLLMYSHFSTFSAIDARHRDDKHCRGRHDTPRLLQITSFHERWHWALRWPMMIVETFSSSRCKHFIIDYLRRIAFDAFQM